MEKIKINKLEIENTKRVKAVKLMPTQNGLTVIGGDNGQGKTSVLDSIAWLLGGDSFRPSEPQNADSVNPPYLRTTLSNGLVVERKGKNSSLKVTDPSGDKAGQRLLDDFVGQLALNLPAFMAASDKDKAKTLLHIIGVEEQIASLEQKEKELYSDRQAIGRIADQKKKFADEQPYYPDAPDAPVSPAELIKEQQEILARNGENQKKRGLAEKYRYSVETLRERAETLQSKLDAVKEELEREEENLRVALLDAQGLEDESTAELEASLLKIEEINRKVRANLDKNKAEEDAREMCAQYDRLTAEINHVRASKADLLEHADLPLAGLTVEDGRLKYNGYSWDNMSGSDQLKVATSIVRKLNPKCGFVLLDKLEQMDVKTMQEFGQWAEAEGLQIIATRVSRGGECTIIIEDGYALGEDAEPESEPKMEKRGFF